MNVAIGAGTSPSLCSPPKSDTSTATASGRWVVCESTSRLLPRHSGEYERQALLRAAESGNLAIRRIQLTKEKNYFSGEGAPRPFTLVMQGFPTEGLPERFGEVTVGIINPRCLYTYKRDANTRNVLRGVNPDELEVKLLPDRGSLRRKCMEKAERAFWSVYPPFTSGHLGKDGLFSLPKRKFWADACTLPFPELVTLNYGVADIKCFYVEHDPSNKIANILLAKRYCELELDLKPLPLVVYCKRTGSVEVCFDDELDSNDLASNEDALDDFVLSHDLSNDTFRAMLNLLPMLTQAEVLRSKLLTVSPDVKRKRQQAIDLVSNPDSYSYEKLLELKQNGLPVQQHFFHEEFEDSLLGMLLASEMLRNENPKHEQTRKQDEEACRLCELLLQSGARLERPYLPFAMMDNPLNPVMPPSMMNYLVAAFAPFDFLTLEHLRRIPLTGCPGNVVEFDRICREYTPQQRQSFLEELIHNDVCGLNPPTLETLQPLLLALFHYEISMDQRFLNRLKVYLESQYHDGKKIIGDLSLNDYIQWLDNLFKQRKEHPFYQNWPEHVRKAHVQIAELKQSLDLPDDASSLTTPSAAETPAALQFMVDAFSKPPVMPENAGDNEKTILKVLQHYYRRPGPERVIQSLGKETLPTVWKPLHSCSHVLRARNNGHWYMELLEKFQQCSLSPREKQLLSLAIIYHDAAAEDVVKSVEESRSADYFKRDLTGHYPEPLLNDIALAMVSKENDVNRKDEQSLPEPVRWYLRILRFADRMDIIRVFGVGADFPKVMKTQPRSFDATRLDLPPQLPCDFNSDSDNKSEFQRHLEAAMHGAADLAQVTGRPQDQRKKNYTEIHGLCGNGAKISENFEWTTEPVQRMNQFIDDNVRRKMAQEADIIVCSDRSHGACKADQSEGITYGIHNSWHDLRQVQIPAKMTLLEKMQYEHDPSLMSPTTQQALAKEVQRLKNEGIRMNLGTLTQNTLASEEAQQVLKERGIAVVSHKRPYFTNDGHPREWEMLVPEKTAKRDALPN
ncbi:hypothetical protein [Endozoicomonas sp. ISHI1]|uniref:hypothetical protein n=1 Tax=Endozoicomonas sp. ISHI1 TaxID=2825882 RepID=UPI002148200E|nr:hypothetical protein [Endozoicomonas sp. ISHI1]